MIENNIKRCRETLEMTQEELGYIFGVSNKTVAGWENGYDTMPLTKMIKFANLYHYSLDYITGLAKENYYKPIKNINKDEIGKKLKIVRKKLNLTQQKIADECSISQTTYSNYENGLYLITSLNLFTICKNHSISIDKLLTYN